MQLLHVGPFFGVAALELRNAIQKTDRNDDDAHEKKDEQGREIDGGDLEKWVGCS